MQIMTVQEGAFVQIRREGINGTGPSAKRVKTLSDRTFFSGRNCPRRPGDQSIFFYDIHEYNSNGLKLFKYL